LLALRSGIDWLSVSPFAGPKGIWQKMEGKKQQEDIGTQPAISLLLDFFAMIVFE